MNKEWLEDRVSQGKSIAEIANECGKGKTTVRHWLSKYNLVTTGKSGQKAIHPEKDGKKICSKCNVEKDLSEFYVRSDRDTVFTYCKSCSRESTKENQNFIKDFGIQMLGGKCSRCQGTFKRAQYAFHHLDPEEKDFNISEKRGITIPQLKKELEKCVLVCHNCHSEIHAEIAKETGYKNKIKDNSERWVLSKQVHLDWIGKHSCECCGYDEYQGALSILMPEGVERINTIYINDDEYGKALKEANVVCLNCLNEAQSGD